MSTRTEIADALQTALPGTWRVVDHSRAVDRVGKDRPLVMVYREQIAPGPTFELWDTTLAIWLLTGHTDPELAEDALDAALPVLVAALDDLPALTWTTAERGTFDDTFHSYKITSVVHTTKE